MNTKLEAVIGARAIDALRGRRILLAGATGKNGRRVLRQLVELGFTVRAMSRTAPPPVASEAAAAEWVAADVTRPETLAPAVAGVDIVISAVATAKPFGANRPERVDYEGTKHLAEAAKAAGVRRLVIITSSVSGRRGGLLNLLARNVLVWKGEAEAALVRSGLEYGIVGPGWINDEPGGEQPIRILARADYRRGMAITRDDLASVVIAAAGEPLAANRAFTAINAGSMGGVAEVAAWRDSFATMPGT